MSKDQQEQHSNHKKNQLSNYAKFSALGLQMIIIIVAGVFGGFYLDDYLGLNIPVFTLAFSLISVGIAIYLAVKDFIKNNG